MIKRRCKICNKNRQLREFASYRREICLHCNPATLPPPDKPLDSYEAARWQRRERYYNKVLRETGQPPPRQRESPRENPNVSRGARMNPIMDFSAIDRILAGDAPPPARERDDGPNDLGTSTPAR